MGTQIKTARIFLVDAVPSGKNVTLNKEQLQRFIDFCTDRNITKVFIKETPNANASLLHQIIDIVFGLNTSIHYYGQQTLTVANVTADTWYNVVFRGRVIFAVTEDDGLLKAGVFRPSVQKIIPIARQEEKVK